MTQTPATHVPSAQPFPSPAPSGAGPLELAPPVLITLTWDQLILSPLNPANRQDSDLSDLKTSIREKGILSSLVVRPHAEKLACFEVVCGERRTRAVGELIGEGVLGAGFELVCQLKELSDAELILMAAEENLRRQDMSPLETLRAYQSALKHGATLAQIARSFDKTVLKVQRHIAIVERGSAQLLEALHLKTITVGQAATIVAAPTGLRDLLLERALEGLGAEALGALARGAGIPTSSARFDLSPHAALPQLA